MTLESSSIQKNLNTIHFSSENEALIPNRTSTRMAQQSAFKVELKSISWIWEIALRVVLGGVIFYFSEIRIPFQRQIEVTEWHNYNYPHKDSSSIPFSGVVLFVILGPTILVTLVVLFNLCRTDNASRRWRKKYARNKDNKNTSNWISRVFVEYMIALLAASMSYILVQLITDIIKTEYGRPRPDFLSRCYSTRTDLDSWYTLPSRRLNNSIPGQNMIYIEDVPPLVDHEKDCVVNGLTDDENLELIQKGGRKSFPSGHTSMAFAGSTFCALYSFYWLRRWSSSLKLSYGEESIPFPGSSVGSAFLFCFFLPGIYVGVSRTQDYRHHGSDVIVGGLIGIFITTVVFLQYYSFQPRKTRKTFPNSLTVNSINSASSNL